MINYINGFKIFGFDIKFYGILMATAMALGVLIACFNSSKRNLKSDDILCLACFVLPLAVIGARVYYFIFSLDYYTSFWQIFEVWNGGLAIYGGVIGGAIGILIYCLIYKKNFLDVADVVVPSLIFGQALGRWGNFFNQEAYGTIVTNESYQWFPFAVYIENEQAWHLATFFYESIWNLLVFIVLLLLLRKSNIKQRGVITGFYFILYGIGRIFIEGLRTDSLYIGSIRVSQLLSGILILVGILLILIPYIINKKKNKKKDFIDLFKK